MPGKPTLLFVYGTLKRGDVRAPLLDGQRFVGEAETLPRYRLFNTGAYPALVEAEAVGLQGLALLGELWSVDAACLARLDVEEGVDEGLYERRPIMLAGESGPAQSYFYLPTTGGMDDLGDHWPACHI